LVAKLVGSFIIIFGEFICGIFLPKKFGFLLSNNNTKAWALPSY